MRHGAVGGKELEVAEVPIRHRRWATRVAVAFGLPPGLAGDGSSNGERRGGASRQPRATLDR